MKLKKMIIFVLICVMAISSGFSYVYADMARIPSIYTVGPYIIELCIYIIAFIYVIIGVVYFCVSKEDKKHKGKRLIKWLCIVGIVCFVLWCVAQYLIINARSWY